MSDNKFMYGCVWLRADFHLHTRADKEFKYEGEDDRFIASYIEKLKSADIGLGVITNHNKFNLDEFKALRKKARREHIGLLPGVELSVNDGASGVHTLIVFSDEWIEKGHDFINQFLGVTFAGKVASQYEQENGRSNDDLVATLKKLEEYGRDFFVIFAHVEDDSGLWKEIGGGRMSEIAAQPLVKKYVMGFQKVRSHDKTDSVCRTKVQNWWEGQYPAEVEGSDPKTLEQIGKGKKNYIKIGSLDFDAVKFALIDHKYRVSCEVPEIGHSHVNAIRFEGGLLDGKQVTFSPHLNCLIGIQGSGKSSILESLRYALDIPFGEKSQDQEYKKGLLPYILKSGGKIIVDATDCHGTRFEIRRLHNHGPEVYIDNELKPGVSIRESIIAKPLYFGQKDLAAAGKDFGHDLVEKLMGDSLKDVRVDIIKKREELQKTITDFKSIHSDIDEKEVLQEELSNINFRLEQFDKHDIKEKLEKQLAFSRDLNFCDDVNKIANNWYKLSDELVAKAEGDIAVLERRDSEQNSSFFQKYNNKVDELKETVRASRTVVGSIDKVKNDLVELEKELSGVKDSLREEFAEVERELVKTLEKQGVKSIEPDAYIKLTDRQAELTRLIANLERKTEQAITKKENVLRALASLNNSWHNEYKLIEKALKDINSTQSSLKVEGDFKGNRSEFKSHIDSLFRGNNFRKEIYGNLAEAYSDFGEIFKNIEAASIHAKSRAGDFKELFFKNLDSLLTYQVPNSYTVTYHGRPLRSHSLGQRASAMMLFLLSQKGNDLLLVDQPEDDLDSQTIYEEVVKILREIKPKQQFVFATHNANFPVLGDAETITTCSANDEEIKISVGNIDDKNCQSHIINIMEGGPEAFGRRKTIYQIWRSGE